jgi:hypothetical protein
MGDTPPERPQGEALQFDHAEPVGPKPALTVPGGGSPCAVCKRALEGEYYEVNAKTLCGTCRTALQTALASPPPGAMKRAILRGIGAAILGAVLFYAVMAITGYQIGLVGVVVGYGVGIVVRRASGNRGGRRFQVLAVALTYLSIASTNGPEIFKELRDMAAKDHAKTAQVAPASVPSASATSAPPVASAEPAAASTAPPKPLGLGGLVVGLLFVFGIIAVSPFFTGFFGIVILAIALWEAWRINRAAVLVVRGPFRVGG